MSEKCAGGLVLCGGRSRRMGADKAWLPFGEECLLQRVVRIVTEVAEPVVAAASQGQVLPPLPEGVAAVRDVHEQPRLLVLACQETDQFECGFVRPMGIFDCDHHRSNPSHGLQHLGNGIVQTQPRRLGFEVRRRLQAGHVIPFPQLGEQCRQYRPDLCQ